MSKPYYRPDVDGLRGVAVLLVIAYHLAPGQLPNGFLGVDVFFVISGFVVTRALERDLELGATRGLLDFYARRVKRILPALYVNVGVVTLLCCMLVPPPELRRIFKTAGAAVVGASNIALLYGQFDYFNLDLALNPFVQTWSLGVEEQFYLLFPALLLVLRTLTARVPVVHGLSIITMLSFLLWLSWTTSSPVAAFYNPLARFWELFVGCLLGLGHARVGESVTGAVGATLQIVGVALLASGTIPIPGFEPFGAYANVAVVIGSACVIAIGIPARRTVTALLSAPALVWIGSLSYSLYLWHYPVFAILRWNADLARPEVALGALALTFAIAWASYRLIELPVRHAPPSGAKVILTGAVSAIGLLVLVVGVNRVTRGRLYLGERERYESLWPASNEPLTASVVAPQSACMVNIGESVSDDAFDVCKTSSRGSRFIYLVGNSHAQHLAPMLEVLAQRHGFGYSTLTASDCQLTTALQVMPTGGVQRPYEACRDYFVRSMDRIERSANPKDLVLIGSLSMLDKPSSEDSWRPSASTLDGRRLSRDEAYRHQLRVFTAFSRKLRERGIHIVFAGPTPRFELLATQCGTEWFRAERAGCRMRSDLADSAAARYGRTVDAIARESDNAHYWNPHVDLCESQGCPTERGGQLLYRDRHHLSSFGSAQLSRSFERLVQSIDVLDARPNAVATRDE